MYQDEISARRPLSRVTILYGSVIVLMCTASSALQAALLDPGLLTVSNNNQLRRFTFAGAVQEQLPITGLPATAVAQGVSVVNNRIFIGMVSTNATFLPKIVEVNPVTGAAMSTMNTATPYLTALGDDGTNLLLLDSVNKLDVYTYTISGTPVGAAVAMTRPFAGLYQAYGISGNGQSVFMSYNSSGAAPLQPILTNTTGGAAVSYFATGMSSLANQIGGLSYSVGDNTLWVAGTAEFRHYTLSGTLLATVPLGSAYVFTGLEVVPEPSTLSMLAIAGMGWVWQRRIRKART